MLLKTFVSADMGENCYVVVDETNADKPAVVIDPGDAVDVDKICSYLGTNGINVVAVCLTHCHFDHCGAADGVSKFSSAPIFICEGEEIVAEKSQYNLTAMVGNPRSQHYDRVLKDGEKFAFGSLEFEVIKTPGHTPGGCCYYFKDQATLFAGDTLFFMSCGRTDFPGGSEMEISKSIKDRLFKLPDDVTVYCGHGNKTSIGYEKVNNILA